MSAKKELKNFLKRNSGKFKEIKQDLAATSSVIAKEVKQEGKKIAQKVEKKGMAIVKKVEKKGKSIAKKAQGIKAKAKAKA